MAVTAMKAAAFREVPAGWTTERLGDLGTWYSGGTPSMAAAAYWNGDIPWVSPKDMKALRLVRSQDWVTRAAVGNGTRVVPAGALLVVVRGMILAHSAPVACAARPVAFNQDIKALVPRPDVDSEYVLQWLAVNTKLLLATTTESTHGTKKLASEDLFALSLPLPPLTEQRAIAAALRDADSLLMSEEQLIAKRRDVKQAAMQRLLTGEQRLPGFDGYWERRRLGEVLRVRHGKSQHAVSRAGGAYPILATSGEIGRTDQYLWDGPSVLIGRKGTIDAPQYVDTPFWTIDTLFYTEVLPRNDAKFLFYVFNTICWRDYNEASGVPSLNASTIERIEFACPDLAEQRAIAAVLSDMDAELAALDRRLAKTRALKQAMMQDLLTGRRRLAPSA